MTVLLLCRENLLELGAPQNCIVCNISISVKSNDEKYIIYKYGVRIWKSVGNIGRSLKMSYLLQPDALVEQEKPNLERK